jgi:uncharacterized protein
VHRAYHAAAIRFQTVLTDLVSELPLLRKNIPRNGLGLQGDIARTMEAAVQPFWDLRVTPMAAVAGAVAQHMLLAMLAQTNLTRAYVNNGGDIAFHLEHDETFAVATPAGTLNISSTDPGRGIATSGWRGRSFSLGIADAVTAVADSAAEADVAATLIANAVDLPGSAKIKRQSANSIAPDSDLGPRLVTVDVEQLDSAEIDAALDRGLVCARQLWQSGHIHAAQLLLQHEKRVFSPALQRGVDSIGRANRQIAQARHWH